MRFSTAAHYANLFVEQVVLGLTELVSIDGIGQLTALVDSGNGAYNALHGVDIEEHGSDVSFTSVDNKRVTCKKVDDIMIHVGSGNKETRPCVELNMVIQNKQYQNVRFSIADRTENEHPVLLSAEFIGNIDALIDVKG